MNKRGQALIEFILVLPVFIFIVLGMIDFGNIIYQKYKLENELDLITNLYSESKENEILEFSNKIGAVTSISTSNNYVTITLKKNVKITTPGLNIVLGNPHTVEVSRVIYEE